MGKVIVLPMHSHARASSTSGSFESISDKDFKVISAQPRSAARRDSASRCLAGMPRKRQQLTAAGFSDKAAATTLLPPKALMMESGVSIADTVVCDLQTSQEFAHRKTTFVTGCDAIRVMPDPREVVYGRLEALRNKLTELDPEAGFDVQLNFAAAIGLHKTSWSQIKNFTRDLPLTAACRAKDKWSISLDWIYYGEQPAATQLMAQIGRGPAAEASAKGARSSKPPLKPAKRKTA